MKNDNLQKQIRSLDEINININKFIIVKNLNIIGKNDQFKNSLEKTKFIKQNLNAINKISDNVLLINDNEKKIYKFIFSNS